MAFSPHLMGASGMMSPVYLPGSNFSGPANGGANGAGANAWRNTGDAYDRDGNVSPSALVPDGRGLLVQTEADLATPRPSCSCS